MSVNGTREEPTSSSAVRVGSAVRRGSMQRASTVRTDRVDGRDGVARRIVTASGRAGGTRSQPTVGGGATLSAQRNRRPPGPINVTGTATRRPINASPHYGGHPGRYARSGKSGYGGYGGRYGTYGRPYRGHGYYRYPNHYHVYYPGYVRPQLFGSFFYFPGYSFSVGFGFGYPAAFGHFGYSGYAAYPYGYGYAPYGYVGYTASPSYADPYTGFLRLKVRPRDAQVFVDGSYVGLVDHFDGWTQRLRLEEGTHQIEILHPNYIPIEFEVLIVTGEKVTFEEDMAPR